jgi:hypothetical protein
MNHDAPRALSQITRGRRFTGVAVALGACALAAALSGCEAEQSPSGASAGGCSSPADCPADMACAVEVGACVVQGAAAESLALHVVPPNGSALAPLQHWIEASATAEDFEAMLPDAVVIHGRVGVQHNPMVSSIGGRIVAEAVTEIQGVRLRTEATVLPHLRDDGWAFSLKLIPDRRYRLTFYPDDSTQRPPLIEERTFSAEDNAIILQVPELDAYPVISGQLFDASGSAEGEPPAPLGAVRVVALAASPWRDATSLPLVSTAAITDSKFGRFELRVTDVPSAYVLRFEPTEAMGPRVIAPTQTLSTHFGVHTSGAFGERIDVGSLLIDTQIPAPLTVSALARDATGALVPVSGASVRLSGEHGDGSLRIHGVTAGASAGSPPGTWSGAVLPGAYTLSIVPPPDSPAAAWTGALVVEHGGSTITVELGERLRLHGAVWAWTGAAVPHATVQARPEASEGDEGENREVQITADEDGHFTLHADPGRWRLWTSPPEDGALPRHPGVEVEVHEDGTWLDLTLPPPRAARGRVVDSAGQPVSGARVDVYGSPSGGDDPAAPVHYSSGITGEDGRFLMLIPAQ